MIFPGSGFMGVAATLLSRALGLTALGIVMLTAMAGADPAADAKLVSKPINKGIAKIFKKYPLKQK